MSDLFDTYNSAPYYNVKPMSSIDYEDEDALLKWLNDSIGMIRSGDEGRFERIRFNRLRYQGYYHFLDPRLYGRNDLARDRLRANFNEVYTNLTQKNIKALISRVLYNRPNTVVVPASSEAGDKEDAKVSKQVLDSLKYENRIDNIYYDMLLESKLAGESYCFALWDENRGAEHPKFSSVKGKKIPLYNSNGEKILNDSGEPLLVSPPKRVGDVRYFVPLTEDVIVWPAYKFEDSRCVALRTMMHVDDAKKKWPDKADYIKASVKTLAWDDYSMREAYLQDFVLIYHFWHKSVDYLEDGLYCLFTPDVFLEEPRPLDITGDSSDGAELGNIPCVRLVDIKIPGMFHGWSSMHNINQLQSRYDRCTTLTDRNIFLVCHPKVMIPSGSNVAIEEMGADALAVVYQGNQPPTIASYAAGTQEVFAYAKELEGRIESLSDNNPIAFGSPPPGTRSNAQQMFWQEQQEQRNSLIRINFHQAVVELDRKVLCLVAAKYRDHDERLIRIMGADKTWETKTIDITSLSKSFNIRIEASSALPEFKSARIETLMNLIQVMPGLFTREQVLSMLDFGQADRFIDLGKIAIDTSDQEFEMLQKGEEVPAPEKYEEHIAHLNNHYKQIQAMSFKSQPDDVKKVFFKHIGMHEMFCWAIAGVNPLFVEQLKTLPQFPCFFVLPPEPEVQSPAPAPLPTPPINGPAPEMPQGQPLQPGQSLNPQSGAIQ